MACWKIPADEWVMLTLSYSASTGKKSASLTQHMQSFSFMFPTMYIHIMYSFIQ